MSTDDVKAKTRTRSPAYPIIDLESAIERAQVIYKNEGRNAANVEVAIEHWGYERGSSNGMRAIAALLQFGLLEDEGKKDARQVKLTRRAMDILMPDDELSHQRTAVREAALLPPLHKEIWDKYNGNLPSDANLRRYLIIERHFNDNAADPFIRQFRSTIAYADLPGDDIIDVGGDDAMDDNCTKAGPPTTVSPPHPAAQRPMQNQCFQEMGAIEPFISFPLPGGNAIEIRLRSKVSKKDFERIKMLVDLSEPSLVKDDDQEGGSTGTSAG